MNCPKCGNEINENQKFCSNCGANLSGKTENNMKAFNTSNQLFYPIIGGACVLALLFAGFSFAIRTNTMTSQPTEIEETEEDNGKAFDSEIARKMQAENHNCVYVTTDYVCFTTHIFKAEPIKNFDKSIQEYDYWLGAKDACESKGHRLPNDDELRSLFSDILGIEVNSGIDVKSEKYSDSNIPTDFEILKKIAPKQEHDNIYLWEN